MKKLMVDPPEGWRYGFPKPVHEEFHTLGEDFDLEKWFISEGYPKERVRLAVQYSRYFEKDVDDET